jgi:polysaccharide export outer membrane protein
MTIRNFHYRLRLVLFTLALSGGLPAAAPADSPAQFATRQPRYRIQLSDELEISFRFTPEFDQKVTVQPDGFISLEDVGDLYVRGLTLEEVTHAIASKYAGILREPVVTVRLTGFAKPYFIIGGEVAKPGKYEFREPLTLSDAVAIAGGFTVGAKTSEVLLFRRFSEELVEVKRVNVKVAQRGALQEDVRLRAGDSIFVPRSRVGKVERFMAVSRLGLYFPVPVF